MKASNQLFLTSQVLQPPHALSVSLPFVRTFETTRQQEWDACTEYGKGPTIKRKAEKLYAILVTPNEGSETRVSIEGTEK